MLLPIFRLILLVTFALAGVAKLRDRLGTARTLKEFGVPERLCSTFALLLPIAELLTALALLMPLTAQAGALASLFLLFVFLGGIGYNLAHHRKPACNCFGQASSQPIGPSTIVRNLLLAACTVPLLVLGPGPGFLAWLSSLSQGGSLLNAIVVLLFVIVLVQTIFTAQVLRQQGRMLQRLNALEHALPATYAEQSPSDTNRALPALIAPGLGQGATAPDFMLPTLSGDRASLASLLFPGRPLLLLFMNPHCGPCVALAPEAAAWIADSSASFDGYIVSEGTVEENQDKGHLFPASRTLLQTEREVADAYHAWGTPAALAIAPDGRILTGVAQGADAIRTLVHQLTTSPQSFAPPPPVHTYAPPALAEGDRVPNLDLTLLDGTPVRLHELLAQTSPNDSSNGHLLLFWNPECGFCERMLPDLQAWETTTHEDAPTLLIFCTGAPAFGLQSLVVLDLDSQVANTFGAGGTPMAVLIDSSIRVASSVAAGADAVFTLAVANSFQSAGHHALI